jgi:ATP-dependent RNA helicase RhlB
VTQDQENPSPTKASAPRFLTKTRFDSFDIDERIMQGLEATGFQFCTPIQEQTLPVSLEGRDVAGQAQTGTGKTAAFLITLLTRLLEQPRQESAEPMALVMAPTRELALQIHEEAEALCRFTHLTVGKVIGGVDYKQQADMLREGVDIVIGTPGRIIDYYKQKILKTHRIGVVVIDEADRLLDLGFAKDMRYILRKLPHYEKRQSMLFSATLSHRVMELTYDYMNLPEFIAVTPEELTVKEIDQTLYHVGMGHKLPLLLGILKRESWSRMMVFVNTKSGVLWLEHKLKGNGLSAAGITGDMRQQRRFRLMEQFRTGKIKILIATDVASRGIHVEDVSHVVNYDLPQDAENYIHRIGRTARAGKRGTAISLACETYVFHLEPLEEMLGYKLPVTWHDDDWLERDRASRFVPPRKERAVKGRSSAGRQRRRPGPGRGLQRKRRSGEKKSGKPTPSGRQADKSGENREKGQETTAPHRRKRRRPSRRRKHAARPPESA